MSDVPSPHPAKNWCFTLFYTELPSFPISLPDGLRYLVFQRELCPTSRREHLQGYVQLSAKLRLRPVKLLLQSVFSTTLNFHLAVARGTPDENIAYCTKSDTRLPDTDPVALGQSSGPGKRSDLTAVRNAILSGVTPLVALRDSPDLASSALRYQRSWGSFVAALAPHRDRSIDPVVIVYYGVTRTGKSKAAMDTYPNAFVHAPGKWFDFYEGEKVVIYDDFDGSDCTFSQFKTWFDRYPCFVEYKGGFHKLQATTHIVTTNVYPSHWWSKKVTGLLGRDAIWGRISEIHHYPSVDEGPTVYSPAQFRALPDNEFLESLDPKQKE